MIYITQLIYLNEGQEAAFEEFESVAIPTIAKYNGRLLVRARTPREAIIAPSTEQPYEVHVVEFPSEQDFENFKLDEDRKRVLHLKEKAIRLSVMYKGEKL